ncbi:MAG TPA: CARDB domain-containing protein [Solirubrobacteraceae bacterium]|nr:CARDB domain-containing protein [Solirubrobacteraceae bacterium]
MKRLTAGASALALCALLVATSASSGAQPRTALRAFNCHRALDPGDRSTSLTAVMRPVAGTKHMAMRFDLLMSAPNALMSPRVVNAGDLGVWITPTNPTLGQLSGDVWKLQKSVVNLAAPATYKFRVAFRWTGAGGRPLQTLVRYSPKCQQRELRPDLLVQSIAVTPADNQPADDLYTAVISNAGNSTAGPFQVLFAPGGGGATKTRTVPKLRAHRSVSERFAGPLCTTGEAPTITADSTMEVDDLNRANNSMVATCPAATGHVSGGAVRHRRAGVAR